MRRLSLTVLATVFTALFVGLWAPTAAWADKSKTATLQKCPAGQVMTAGTFTMTDVSRLTQQITVSTRKSVRSFAPPPGFAGGTATYNVTFDAAVLAAQATVPDAWMGSFSLTNITCVASQAPTITTTVSLCGMTPVVLSAFVTNNNPVMLRYTVKLTGLPDRAALLDRNEREEVTFDPLTRGSTYTLTVAGDDDGTNTSVALRVDTCTTPPGPGPAPTTKAPLGGTPQTPGGPMPDATFVQSTESVSPIPVSTEGTPIDESPSAEEPNDDPFHSDNKLVGSPVFWLGIVCCFLPFLCLVAWGILWLINKATNHSP